MSKGATACGGACSCKHHPKAVPASGESGCECNEQSKGEWLKAANCREVFPLSFANAQQNAGWNMVVLQRC